MKISWNNFERRVIGLHISWKLSIRAIEGFKESGEALDSYLTEDYQNFIGLFTKAAKTNGKQITDFPAYRMKIMGSGFTTSQNVKRKYKKM